MTFKARPMAGLLILPLLLQWFRFHEPPFQLPLLPSGEDTKPCVGAEEGNREGSGRNQGGLWAYSGSGVGVQSSLSLSCFFQYRPSPTPRLSPPSTLNSLLSLPEVDRRPGKLVS